MIERKNNIWMALVLLAAVSLACSSLNGQADEANKLVDEANAINQQADVHRTKCGELLEALMGDDLPKVKDLEAHKKANKSKFDEAISESEQAASSMNEAANKLEQASKLDVDPKFKEYLDLGAQTTRKRIDAVKLMGSALRSFVEAKDVDSMNKVIDDHNTRNAALAKEIEDLSAKADQISKDNPTIIGSK
jgi:uncharacterized protein Yka (UPF0111/DUF47 family)